MCFFANKKIVISSRCLLFGLTNDERSLIHNLRVGKTLEYRKDFKSFQTNEHIYSEWVMANVEAVVLFCSLCGIVLLVFTSKAIRFNVFSQ